MNNHPAHLLCAQHNTTVDELCAKLGYKKPLTKHYVVSFLMKGCRSPWMGDRIAEILGCDRRILIWGYPHYLQEFAATESNVLGTIGP